MYSNKSKSFFCVIELILSVAIVALLKRFIICYLGSFISNTFLWYSIKPSFFHFYKFLGQCDSVWIQIIRKLLTVKRNGDFVDVLCRNLLREVGYQPSPYCFWCCVNNVFWKLQVFLCADQHKVLYESVSVVTLWAGFKKLWNTYKQNLAVIVSCDIYHKRFTRNTGVRFGKKHRLSQ